MSWRSCRIGSCQRHCSCMYAPCRSAIPSPGSERAQPMPATLKAETLRALAEKATPGPWEQENGYLGDDPYCSVYVTDDGEPQGLAEFNDSIEAGQSNAELVTYLRNAVPEILTLLEAGKDERVAALEADNARLLEALERCAECDPESAMFAAAALGKEQA